MQIISQVNDSPRKVYYIGPNPEYNNAIGIAYKNGWVELSYYIKEYSSLQQNNKLTNYCKIKYPEFFI